MLSVMMRDENAVITEHTRIYLRDCYDHTIQLMELAEMQRETIGGLTELYLCSASHRMNEVIKVLTIIATIFIPLTFLAGLYGMNFRPEDSPYSMPELSWRYSYPVVLAFMATVVVGMLWWFRRKGWLGSESDLDFEP